MSVDKMVEGFQGVSGTSIAKAPASAVTPPPQPALLEEDTPWPPPDCPPDSQQLGRSTWTLLHTMAANYPEKASFVEQVEMTSFLHIFSKVYPCWYCAADFRKWLDKPENKPKVGGKEEFSLWLCGAHNQVNKKLGKDQFKCVDWRSRWLDGWPDGRCD